uniref:amidase family protein n=1 Tax=Rhizobium sp. RCAM05350 TaxID=2895568 RepID=UPI0020768ACC|nr:amidase family protein [Rhizobium sp. RCAM05350]
METVRCRQSRWSVQHLRGASDIQGQFNAFTFIDVDSALAAARASEARWRRGEPHSAIDGIPTTVKDIVHVEGWCVRYGSKTTGLDVQRQDAPSVARLRKAGAVFVGQTTTSEYGWKAVTDSPLFWCHAQSLESRIDARRFLGRGGRGRRKRRGRPASWHGWRRIGSYTGILYRRCRA